MELFEALLLTVAARAADPGLHLREAAAHAGGPRAGSGQAGGLRPRGLGGAQQLHHLSSTRVTNLLQQKYLCVLYGQVQRAEVGGRGGGERRGAGEESALLLVRSPVQAQPRMQLKKHMSCLPENQHLG